MPKTLLRRSAGTLLVTLSIALAAASCGREDKILNAPVTGPVTYDNTVKHLIADRSEGTQPTGCTSCHHAGTTIPDWTDYGTVYANRANIRAYINTGGAMRQFLKAGEPEVIIAWIDAGAPE